MPNRIIKESICTSDRINGLTDFEFRLWVSLLVSADDAGRGDARPAIIKGRAFPLRERVTVKDIDAALHGLAAAGCVSLYTVGGKPYFQFPTWAAHQRIDRAKPKYPAPEDADGGIDDDGQSAAVCGNPPQVAASRGLNPIQNESESKTNPNQNPKGCSGRAARFTPPTTAEVAEFIAKNGISVDAQHFVDYYTSNGWRVSQNPMRDWRAAVRSWGRRDNLSQPYAKPAQRNPALDYEQRSYSNNDFGDDFFIDLEKEYGDK